MNNLRERTKGSVDLANKILATYAKGRVKEDELAPTICKKLNITKQQLHSAMGVLKRAGKVTWQVPNIVPKRRLVRVKSTSPMKYDDYVPMPPVNGKPAKPAKVKPATDEVTKVTKGNDKGNDKGNGKEKRKYVLKAKKTDTMVQGVNSEITLIAHPTAMARFFRELKQ